VWYSHNYARYLAERWAVADVCDAKRLSLVGFCAATGSSSTGSCMTETTHSSKDAQVRFLCKNTVCGFSAYYLTTLFDIETV
jgi:hypothetical protein